MAVRRTIFVTGGGSAIGRAIAQRFAREGWFVGLGDTDEAAMEETETLLPGGFTYCQPLDVSQRSEWEEALRIVARASGGRIDVLANCARQPAEGSFAEQAPEKIDRDLDIALRGTINGAQAAYPWLRDTAPGSCLLNIGIAAGLYGMPGQALAGVTSAGLRSLTESLDAEWASAGVSARSVMMDPSDTSVEDVAEAAWQAVHGNRLHHLAGKTARKLLFLGRWAPNALRRFARTMAS
ncbi:SDR family NAD(P)-dependent oxidoreductase [Altererythrobacter soli]|uniref:SDR family NAD(P)-dependent oxidoreductase n=1 Tax=Croceibacterium soli TaxID=1739690 RepID=A0A6I4UVZ5_9SPHN|nr:SDR family NAD(P)-dependent oxidoreductase [Croceibacterium soli]MXP41693.1 SDR family NAD(P)-dependent oxidoreductase [Croceibacterium soli]